MNKPDKLEVDLNATDDDSQVIEIIKRRVCFLDLMEFLSKTGNEQARSVVPYLKTMRDMLMWSVASLDKIKDWDYEG